MPQQLLIRIIFVNILVSDTVVQHTIPLITQVFIFLSFSLISNLPKFPKLSIQPISPPLQEKLFSLSIFLFSQMLCSAEMKNGNWDSTHRTAQLPFK